MSMMGRIEAADRLLRIEEVKMIVGLGKSMIYQRMRAGSFPKACKAGGSSRWSEREVHGWVEQQLAARMDINER